MSFHLAFYYVSPLYLDVNMQRQIRWGESLILVFPLSLELKLDGGVGSPLTCALWRSFLCKWSITNLRFRVSCSWDRWLLVLDWILLVCFVCCVSTLTLRVRLCSLSLIHSRLTKWSSFCEPMSSSLFCLEFAIAWTKKIVDDPHRWRQL